MIQYSTLGKKQQKKRTSQVDVLLDPPAKGRRRFAPYERFAAGKTPRCGDFHRAGNEARTRFPASRKRPVAIFRNPAGTSNCTRLGRGWRQRVLLLRKKRKRTSKADVLSLWSGQRGSNSLPPPWQGGALPDELCPRDKEYSSKEICPCQGVASKFFSFVSAVSSAGVSRNSTSPTCWLEG